MILGLHLSYADLMVLALKLGDIFLDGLLSTKDAYFFFHSFQ